MKENLKPCVYDRREHHMKKCNRVLFVERSGELRRAARRKARTPTSEGKPSLKRAESHAAQTRNRVIYPCPGYPLKRVAMRCG